MLGYFCADGGIGLCPRNALQKTQLQKYDKYQLTDHAYRRLTITLQRNSSTYQSRAVRVRASGSGNAPMRVFAGKCDWLPIGDAPYEQDLELFVTDFYGSFYGLRYPCRRTAQGWVKSDQGTPLAVTPVKWRP